MKKPYRIAETTWGWLVHGPEVRYNVVGKDAAEEVARLLNLAWNLGAADLAQMF
jgi:hypothetical protein